MKTMTIASVVEELVRMLMAFESKDAVRRITFNKTYSFVYGTGNQTKL